jgi:glycosyltransferase involved in cell wall biosynthesis
LPSVFKQTYKNLEIIIVGDCCTDGTAELLGAINDPRLHFFNLPERGNYPQERKALWQVAGSAPKNKALELCRGKWIAPLDDDDVFTPNHIEVLLRYAQESNLEFVYGKLKIEVSPGEWKEKGFVKQEMSMQNSTTLFRGYLKLFRPDSNAWRIGMTGDYHRTIRYRETGVRIGFLNEFVALMPLRPGQRHMGLMAQDRPGVVGAN